MIAVKTMGSEGMAEAFEKSGYQEKEEIKFLCWNNIYKTSGDAVYTFFCAFDGDVLIGVAKLKTKGQESLHYPGFFNYFSFLSVKENYQNQGVSKMLIEEMFKFIKNEDLDHLLISGYTNEGFQYLRKNLRDGAVKLGIKFQDDDRPSFP